MRKIVKTYPARKVILYQCKNCRTKYNTRREALECEKEPIEKAVFKVGDRVTWVERRSCGYSNKGYILDGMIKKVCGPELPDDEYNKKWLGSKLTGQHVYMYLVSWVCPHCQEKYSGKFYSPELKKL